MRRSQRSFRKIRGIIKEFDSTKGYPGEGPSSQQDLDEEAIFGSLSPVSEDDEEIYRSPEEFTSGILHSSPCPEDALVPHAENNIGLGDENWDDLFRSTSRSLCERMI